MVPIFLPWCAGASTSSDSGAGDVGKALALRPPSMPSLDFALGFAGDGEAARSSSGVMDIGVGDFVRARPPNVPSRLRGEGADDVGG